MPRAPVTDRQLGDGRPVDSIGATPAVTTVDCEQVEGDGNRGSERCILREGERGNAKHAATRARIGFFLRLGWLVSGVLSIILARCPDMNMRLGAVLLHAGNPMLAGQTMCCCRAVGEGMRGRGSQRTKRIEHGERERRFETKSFAQSGQHRAWFRMARDFKASFARCKILFLAEQLCMKNGDFVRTRQKESSFWVNGRLPPGTTVELTRR